MMATFFSTSVYAQQADAKRFYIGAGGSYAVENVFEDTAGGFENSWGLNLKFGYNLHPLADIEFDFDYLEDFEYNGSETAGVGIEGDPSLAVATYMAAIKGYFPINSNAVKLSAIVGLGIMDVNLDGHFTRNNNDADLCYKLGLGMDLFATPDVSFGLEGNWTRGAEDLNDIEYFNFTLGVAYHF